MSGRSRTSTPTIANRENLDYLRTKRDRMGHLLTGLEPAGPRTEMLSGEATADDAPWHKTAENEGETR